MDSKTISKQKVFLPLAFTVVVADQLGRHHLAGTIEIGERVPVLGSLLALTHSPTTGGALGLFQNWLPSAQLFGFVSLSAIAVLMIAMFYRGLARGEHASAAALGSVLGGISSHTVDRVRYGVGVDFLHLGPTTTDFLPDFNLADVAIVLGVVALIVELLANEMAARVSERPRG